MPENIPFFPTLLWNLTLPDSHTRRFVPTCLTSSKRKGRRPIKRTSSENNCNVPERPWERCRLTSRISYDCSKYRLAGETGLSKVSASLQEEESISGVSKALAAGSRSLNHVDQRIVTYYSPGQSFFLTTSQSLENPLFMRLIVLQGK